MKHKAQYESDESFVERRVGIFGKMRIGGVVKNAEKCERCTCRYYRGAR